MEKNWFYSADGQEKKGPVPESELQQLLASGHISAATLVWSEGMANWAPASSVAALQPPSAAAPVASAAGVSVAAATVTGGVPVPQGLGGWMTFVGVMHIVGGAFACLSCIGLIYGIPMIIGGVGLIGAKNLFNTLPSIDPAMLPALEKQRSAFKALGWSYIMMFIFTVIFMIVYGVVIFAMIGRMQNIAH
jgi:hypothetical protein